MTDRRYVKTLCAICVLDKATWEELPAVTIWQGTALCRPHLDAWIELAPFKLDYLEGKSTKIEGDK